MTNNKLLKVLVVLLIIVLFFKTIAIAPSIISKVISILLVMVLLCRPYIGWVKNSSKKIIPILTGIFALAISPIMVIFLTLFEVLFCLSVVVIVFLLRKPISSFIKKISIQKLGKLKVVGCILVSVVVLWFGLAVFYRTDIGMPIGVQNYLFHKYHEEFDVNGFFGATIAGHPTNQLTCCPKDGNPATDAFNVVRKNTLSIGSRRFASDNYYGIIIRDDYEKYVSDIVSKYFDEFKIYVEFNYSGLNNVKYMSDELNNKVSLNDFFEYQRNYQKGCNTVYIYIYAYDMSDEGTIKSINQSVLNDMSKNISLATIHLNVFDEEEYYRINRNYFDNNQLISTPIQISTIIDYKYEVIEL